MTLHLRRDCQCREQSNSREIPNQAYQTLYNKIKYKNNFNSDFLYSNLSELPL